MNELNFFVSIFIFLVSVVGIYKYFGTAGLYAYMGFATILANIQVCKSIELFGLYTTAGDVLYASTFLCTDILSERHGKEYAKKAVWLGVIINILWIAGTQLTLMFTPSSADSVQPSLEVVLGMVPRISAASLIAYMISQAIDVSIYHFVWKKTGNGKKGLWIRNNVATMTAQLFDSVIFTTLAFLGTVPIKVFWQMMFTSYLFKVIIGLCDTPFIYIARSIKGVGTSEYKKEEMSDSNKLEIPKR